MKEISDALAEIRAKAKGTEKQDSAEIACKKVEILVQLYNNLIQSGGDVQNIKNAIQFAKFKIKSTIRIPKDFPPGGLVNPSSSGIIDCFLPSKEPNVINLNSKGIYFEDIDRTELKDK